MNAYIYYTTKDTPFPYPEIPGLFTHLAAGTIDQIRDDLNAVLGDGEMMNFIVSPTKLNIEGFYAAGRIRVYGGVIGE